VPPPTPPTCWIRKRKRPSGDGLWGAYEVARDEHGVWLYTPEGSRYRGTARDGSVGHCFAGQPDAPGLHVVHLVPSGAAWWFGLWKEWDGVRHLSIDVCSPATPIGDEWAYVDLELDLYKSSDGTVGVYDEDEFDEAVAAGLIDDAERRACLDVAAQLEPRLRTHVDPLLDEVAWARLADAVSLGLPPIVDLPEQAVSRGAAG
jgi:hypothetical protein